MDQFSLDHLTETEFEQFCYDLLVELSFSNVNWRKGTGLSSSPSDRGRDIECERVIEDIDGETYLETWFVECKHYKQGIPPDAIQGALAWATSERPDKLLIIASNFLSNPTKDSIKDYIRNNKPTFRIKSWERPYLERLCLDKTDLLRKYKLAGVLSENTLSDQMRFLQSYIGFERTLSATLFSMGLINYQRDAPLVVLPVTKKWHTFASQVGSIPKRYRQIVQDAGTARDKFAQGDLSSYTQEELIVLTQQLNEASEFVRDYSISIDILPLLKQKYRRWIRPDIRAVRIIQKNRSVFLEMVTEPASKAHADEEVSRINLGFIIDGNRPMFPPKRTSQENAEWFVENFDPFSIINCTYLFTKEGCYEVNDLYQQGKL